MQQFIVKLTLDVFYMNKNKLNKRLKKNYRKVKELERERKIKK